MNEIFKHKILLKLYTCLEKSSKCWSSKESILQAQISNRHLIVNLLELRIFNINVN